MSRRLNYRNRTTSADKKHDDSNGERKQAWRFERRHQVSIAWVAKSGWSDVGSSMT
jgi:hypothetical protein